MLWSDVDFMYQDTEYGANRVIRVHIQTIGLPQALDSSCYAASVTLRLVESTVLPERTQILQTGIITSPISADSWIMIVKSIYLCHLWVCAIMWCKMWEFLDNNIIHNTYENKHIFLYYPVTLYFYKYKIQIAIVSVFLFIALG